MKKETKEILLLVAISIGLLYALKVYGKKYQSVSDEKVAETEYENANGCGC